MLSSNDPPMPSKTVKELNGKRKRDDKKMQSLELRKCRRSPGGKLLVWPLSLTKLNCRNTFIYVKFGGEEDRRVHFNLARDDLPSKNFSVPPVEHGENLVGERIKVWWPADKKYYEGAVTSFDSGTKKHTVVYADGDVERLDLKGQQWELVRRMSPLLNLVDAVSHDEEYYSRDKGKKIRELDSDLEDDDEEYECAFTPEEDDSENTDLIGRGKLIKKGKTYLHSEENIVKKGLKTRSSPHNMSYAASHISNNPSLKSYVERMGFGKILKLRIQIIPSNLAWSILSCYDVGTRCLILNGQRVEITRDLVYEIFGFPIGDLEIDFVKKTNYKNLRYSGLMETFWKQYPKMKRLSYSTKLKGFILNRRTPNDTFKLNFIILLVTTMICASNGGKSNIRFLPTIQEHYENIHMYDWCGLVLKSLDQNPPELPHNCASNQYCGPLTFLTLVYIRWLFQRTKRNEDVIKYCSTDLLRKVDDEHKKLKNFGNFFNNDERFFYEKNIQVVDEPLCESNDALLREFEKQDMNVLLIENKQVRQEESQDMDIESHENIGKQNEILESSKSKEVTSSLSEEFFISLSYEETDVTVNEAAKHHETKHESSKDKGFTIPSSQKPFMSNFNENEALGNQNLERSKEKQVSTVSSEEALFSNVHEVELVEAGQVSREVSSSQSGIICVQGYQVKNVNAPILEAILKEHGDIGAKCVFTNAAVRTSLLEAVCEIVRQIKTNNVTNIISEMEDMESQVSAAEATKINVSWLRAHLESIRKRNEAGKKVTMLMELQTNTILVERAAETDLKERRAKLVAAQNEFAEAERCVEVLKLVKKKLNNDVLESKAERDLWARKQVI